MLIMTEAIRAVEENNIGTITRTRGSVSLREAIDWLNYNIESLQRLEIGLVPLWPNA